jgi:hypothetical protein
VNTFAITFDDRSSSTTTNCGDPSYSDEQTLLEGRAETRT